MKLSEIEKIGHIPNNTIVNADCLEAMKYIPDKSIDCIICDLPYGTTACKWDTIIPFEPLWEQYKRIRKDNTPIVLFGSEPFSTYLRMSNINEFRYDWIWHKSIPTGFLQAKYMPMKNHEIVSVFYKKIGVFNPIKEKRSDNTHTFVNGGIYESKSEHVKFSCIRKETDKDRNPTTVKYFGNVSRHQSLHPTQKPTALLEYLIKTYSNESDLILDNCSGSGSTAIAAYNTRRNFICIEKDEKYYNTSIKRLEDAQAQLRLL